MEDKRRVLCCSRLAFTRFAQLTGYAHNSNTKPSLETRLVRLRRRRPVLLAMMSSTLMKHTRSSGHVGFRLTAHPCLCLPFRSRIEECLQIYNNRSQLSTQMPDRSCIIVAPYCLWFKFAAPANIFLTTSFLPTYARGGTRRLCNHPSAFSTTTCRRVR